MTTLLHSSPRADGFYMPAEWAPQTQTWMIWPERPDNWRLGAKPAQAAHVAVAKAIARFEPVTVCVSAGQYENARARLDVPNIRVVEMSSDDAWVRDSGPTFVINDSGEVRGVNWDFNASLVGVRFGLAVMSLLISARESLLALGLLEQVDATQKGTFAGATGADDADHIACLGGQ